MSGWSNLKPDNEKVTRHKPAFTWTELPEENTNPIPPLPKVQPGEVPWSDLAKEQWEIKWRSPQSTQWTKEMHVLVEQWLYLYESFTTGDYSGAVITGMARIEDKLGLNPKAMMQMRWRIRSGPIEEDKPVLAAVRDLPKRKDPRVS